MRARPAPRRRARPAWRWDPDGRRARILAAAASEFAHTGFRLARLARIARAAGVAESTIYHHFGSKHGVLVALGEGYGTGMARAAFGGLDAEASPGDVAAIVARIFGHVRGTESALAAFLLAQDPLEGGPAQDANRAAMIAAIEAQLVRWVNDGRIPACDTRVCAALQFGLVESALRDCFVRGDGRDEARYRRELVRCLGAYLASPAGPPGSRATG